MTVTYKNKVINGLSTPISQPYSAGHTLNEAEAKVLNQTRSENIGNNVREKVKELQEASASDADIHDHISSADAAYEFTLSNVTASAKLDPVEKEAQNLAKGLLRDHLATTGRKITVTPQGMTDDEWKAKIDSEIARICTLEEIVKAAKKNVDAKRKQADTLRAALGDVTT